VISSSNMDDEELVDYGELLDDEFNSKTFSKRLKYMNRYRPDILYDEIFRAKNPDKYTKELRRQKQAKLARTLHRNTSLRLGVTKPLYDVEVHKELSGAETTSDTPKLLGKPLRLRLSKVSIYPAAVVGETKRELVGILEAYLNGFRFSTFGASLQIDIMYSDVKHAFFQDGDQTVSSLLHFHLHNSIMVGKEMRKDIQFRMVHTTGKQTQMITDRNPVMPKFAAEVGRNWNKVPKLFWRKVEREYGFRGELPLKEPRVFCLTGYCLVELVKAPPLVVTLEEVEIASLVLVEPEKTVFNMTFVFKDFTSDVCQIYSIPVTELDAIKQKLDIRSVKYYQNKNLDLNIGEWSSNLKEIIEGPQEFMEGGGWQKFNGESDASYSDSSEASIEKWLDSPEIDYDSDKEPSTEFKKKNTDYTVDKPGQASNSGQKTREKNEMPVTRILRIRAVVV
ncbi:hypothetical protein MKW94_017356, partial [Papaver nudicaule]|nr:hypothetical protein [Papaver nudicaule]